MLYFYPRRSTSKVTPLPYLQGCVCVCVCVYVGVKGGGGREIMGTRPWVFVVLGYFSLFSPSIDSLLFTLQDKMVTCQLWRHMRLFVRITAIIDPPF